MSHSNPHQTLLALVLGLLVINFGLFAVIPKNESSFLLYGIASFVLVMGVVVLYAKLRNIAARSEIHEQTRYGSGELYQRPPFDPTELLLYWYNQQNKGVKGVLRNMPRPSSFSLIREQTYELVEAELDLEYYTIALEEAREPWTKASARTFHPLPPPVIMPTEFENRVEDFPIEGTLEQQTCDGCGGAGTITCQRCGGDGRVQCSSCNGRGRRKKTRYRGTGANRKRESYWANCPFCTGGKKTCSNCHGHGRVTCPTCAGDGSLGTYESQVWSFVHWNHQNVLKRNQSGIFEECRIHSDLSNKDAETIDGLSLANLSKNFEGLPHHRQAFLERVHSAVLNLEQEAYSFENRLFDRFSFRHMPQVELLVRHDDTDFELIGWGFRPIEERRTRLPNFPLSFPRILGIVGSIVTLWILDIVLHLSLTPEILSALPF